MSSQNGLDYLLKVEIDKLSNVTERSGISDKTGKEWLMRSQSGYLHNGKPYPVEIKIPLQKDQVPYSQGYYYIHPMSFVASKFGEVGIGEMILVPVENK